MNIFSLVLFVLAAYTGFWVIYVLALPLAATLRRAGRIGEPTLSEDDLPSVAVIVPAHNMSAVIERCVSALYASRYPDEKVQVIVVADHCTDDTADIAAAAGATVLKRDDGPAGKTYTLAWTIDKLNEMNARPDAYVITDATARVDAEFLRQLIAVYLDGEDIVVSHALVDAENQKWFARCLGLTLVHRNYQNWARQELQLSALIEGRGMLYSRQYVKRYGWSLALPGPNTKGPHPTEDWRHGVQAVENGVRVAFADDARVVTPLRASLAAATKQGIRWEKGRMANAYSHALRLLIKGIASRDLVKSLAALDAIQPPVAILGFLCVVLGGLTGFGSDAATTTVIGIAPVCGFVVYGVLVVARGRRDGISPITVLWAPLYLLWRVSSFVLAWSVFDRMTTRSQKKA